MVILQVIIAAGLLWFLINVSLNLASLKKPRKHNVLPEPAPLVSVWIPARNEENNIAACLASLEKQTYPNYEVLVLDDNSTDETASVVAGMIKPGGKIRLITGEPLPEGWAGKPFACQQLAGQAGGDWYIFTDADTTHNPEMIKNALSLALELKPSLMSGFPRQIADSFFERIIIPVFYFLIMCWVPLWFLQRRGKSRPTFVIGQFFLFNRDEFWRIGGYEAAKNRIMEDLWMSIEMHNRGGRVITVDLTGEVNCHMYHTVGQMWDGFGKSIFGVARSSPFIIPMLGLIVYLFYLMPFLSLPYQLLVEKPPADWWAVAAVQVALLLVARLLIKMRFRESIFSTILHPLGIGFFIANAIYVLCKQLAGGGIHWKERTYVADSGARHLE
jgi:chlorobactene glucosyltransferase